MTDGPILWYLNRSTGVVMLVLLTLSTVLGVLAMGGRPGRGIPRFVTQTVHRNLALLSVVVLVVHVVSAVADSYVDIRWWQALVPFGATYKTLWLELGTLALDVIVVVVVTSLLRARLGRRAWRAVHLMSWSVFVLAIAHSVGIGTDLAAGTAWAVWPAVVCTAAVLAAGVLRLSYLVRDQETIVTQDETLVRSSV